MKKILILTIVIIAAGIFPAQSKSSDSVYTAEDKEYPDDYIRPWSSSMYIFAGGIYPQGLRTELGYNFASILTLALSLGYGDSWSRDPDEGTFGIIGKFNIPVFRNVSPYLLFGRGGTFTIFGEPDTYTLIYAGLKIQISPNVLLCPETGVTLASRHVSGGSGFFGSSPEITSEKTWFSLGLGFELDF